MMRSIFLPSFFALSFALAATAVTVGQAPPLPPPSAAPERLSERLAKRLQTADVKKPAARVDRERALAKMMEGQSFVWRIQRVRSQREVSAAASAAQQAYVEAAEADPSMSEAYTALAEIHLAVSSGDAAVNEAMALAELSLRVDADNFGARRLLARLYTFKSGLGRTDLVEPYTTRSIENWTAVTRLDPRNSEGWAVLSLFFERQEREKQQIDALQKWISSAPPIDTQFFSRLFGPQIELTPESASLLLGRAFIRAGRMTEAIAVLSLIIADDPENVDAIGYLQEAVVGTSGDAAAETVQSLQQAVFANPSSAALVGILAELMVRNGRYDDAVEVFTRASQRLTEDPEAAAALLIARGQFQARHNRYADAITSFEKAIDTVEAVDGLDAIRDRDFIHNVFDKIIGVYRSGNSMKEAQEAAERARNLLTPDDLFADRHLITLYRESGRKEEAIAVIRQSRVKAPADQGLMRLEATILSEMGSVDEAVAIMRNGGSPGRTEQGNAEGIINPPRDAFSDQLFISELYTRANRHKDAADAAEASYKLARGQERQQIARLTLATAQHRAGDHDGAEATLREILKQSPRNPIALNNLGYFLVEREERLEEAAEMIRKALAVDPTNPSYLDSMGWAYFKLGKYAEAERYLRDAARYNSGSATIHEHLGDVYAKQGKADLARTAWERALTLSHDENDLKRLRAKLAK